LYVEARLDNLHAPGNNSPECAVAPLLFACAGQPFHYNPGITDPDGDSLAFELAAPLTGAGTTVTYQNATGPSSPLAAASFSFDPETGALQFVTPNAQVGALALVANEYRNGTLIGRVMRDIQVYVQPCANTLPTVTGIDGTGKFDATACPGEQVCFYLYGFDADSGQSVTLVPKGIIPGATLTPVPGGALSFCWTPGPNDATGSPHAFVVEARDDACPVNGFQAFTFRIEVRPPQVTLVAEDISCAGSADGKLTAQAGAVNYVWNTNPVQFGPLAQGLAPGSYTVTVTDPHGCTATATGTILEPAEMEIVSAITDLTCHGSGDGAVAVTAGGGSPGYAYLWNTGATTASIQNLPAGAYTVLVSDAHGCQVAHYAWVEQPPAIAVKGQSTPASCHGASTGALSLTVQGGSPPYAYQWSTGSVAGQIAYLPAGVYAVTVQDSHGCLASSSFAVSQPSPLGAQSVVHDATYGMCDGTIALKGTGGTPPYGWQWANGPAAAYIDSLCPGAYPVVVSDDNWCIVYDTVVVGELLPSGVQEHSGVNDLSIDPNPSPGVSAITFTAAGTGVASGILYDVRGRKVRVLFERPVTRGEKCRQEVSAVLPEGIYILVIACPGNVYRSRWMVRHDRR
jgi:hypothetical protein